MKLISDFKDYYDGIAYGVLNDPFYRYERFAQVEDLGLNTNRYDLDVIVKGQTYSKPARFFIIGFCGKLYYGFRCTDPYAKINLVDYFTVKDIEARDKSALTSKYWEYPKRPKMIRFHWSLYNKSMNEVFNIKEIESYFVKYDTPAFVISQFSIRDGKIVDGYPIDSKINGILVNPKLNDYHFAKIVDPYTAAQEIDMYLGNALVQDQSGDMDKISDEDLRDSKGFDKMSFKKGKTKK